MKFLVFTSLFRIPETVRMYMVSMAFSQADGQMFLGACFKKSRGEKSLIYCMRIHGLSIYLLIASGCEGEAGTVKVVNTRGTKDPIYLHLFIV